MLRILVLLSLVFSTVGVTITNCACPKVVMNQTACSKCKGDNARKAKPTCPDCSKHFILKTDFQTSTTEFNPVLQPVILLSPVVATVRALSFYSVISQIEYSITASPGSLEKCALLSTFLI